MENQNKDLPQNNDTANAAINAGVTNQGQLTQQVNPSKPGLRDLIGKIRAKFDSFSKGTKILILVLVFTFVIIFALLLLVAIFEGKRTVYVAPSPTPLVSVTSPPEVILNASRYATDEGVLKIESDLKDIQKQIDKTDVRESNFNIPDMDFSVNFNR